MKLFLTGGDEVAVVLGFEKLELEREVERSKRSEGGKEGVFIATVKNCSPEEIGRTCP